MTEKTWTVYIVSPKENWLLKYILEFDSKEKAIKFGKRYASTRWTELLYKPLSRIR